MFFLCHEFFLFPMFSAFGQREVATCADPFLSLNTAAAEYVAGIYHLICTRPLQAQLKWKMMRKIIY